MSGMPWFRMYTEIIDDETIALLAFEDRWHFVALMAMKGKGILDKPFPSGEFRERAIAKKLGLDIETFKDARARLVDAGLIDKQCQPVKMSRYVQKNAVAARPPAHEWAALRALVFERDDYTCTYCGARGVSLECDHVNPISRGGGNALSNLAAACKPCNRWKAGKTLEFWLAERGARP